MELIGALRVSFAAHADPARAGPHARWPIGSGRFGGAFFVRKGIGWALRERSYAAPDEVAAFCREYVAQLSPLTRREAMNVIARRSAARRPESE